MTLALLARERGLAQRYTTWREIAKAYVESYRYTGTEPWTVLFSLEGHMDPVLASAAASQLLLHLPAFDPAWSDVCAIANRMYGNVTDWRIYATHRITSAEWAQTRAWWVHGTFPTLVLAAWQLTAPETYTVDDARKALRTVADAAREQYQPADAGAMFWSHLCDSEVRASLALTLVTERLSQHAETAMHIARQLGVHEPMVDLS